MSRHSAPTRTSWEGIAYASGYLVKQSMANNRLETVPGWGYDRDILRPTSLASKMQGQDSLWLGQEAVGVPTGLATVAFFSRAAVP